MNHSEAKIIHQPIKTAKKKKSTLREWFDAIFFAVFAATLIRWLLIEAFTIPTPSMEGTLLVGDFLFVSKLHYGAVTPKTPLQLPLTHQKIWATHIPSFLDWIELPQYRLPALTSIERNDVVVFHYPPEDDFPLDLKTNFIKRCVAIPNDSLEIINGQVYVNDKELPNPVELQLGYYVKVKSFIEQGVFKSLNISDFRAVPEGYVIFIQPSKLASVKALEQVIEVTPLIEKKGEGSERVYPFSRFFEWNKDNFGKLWIPKKNMSITITPQTLALYDNIILHYDNFEGDRIEIKNDKLFINRQEVSTYTFKQDYYFMMGDNRHNSEDSRFWGLVPHNHIVGKGLMVWFSLEPEGELEDLLDRVRWNRIGLWIE